MSAALLRHIALTVALVVMLSGNSTAPAAALAGPAGVHTAVGVGVEVRAPPGFGVRAGVAAGFVLPLGGPAVVSTPFRAPASRYGAGHRGVDLAAPVGSAVRAAGAGKVVFAGVLAGRGVVSIEHPIGLRTTYEPVTALVRAGQQVAVGTRIGTLEAGHPSCAPTSCLHWGARLPDGSYVDPMGLLTVLRVRLLPWAGHS